MPWWRFWREDSEDEQQAEERARLRAEQQKQAVYALENGDIPPIAKERIARHNGREDKFFSSDLSVNEFLLMKQSGIEVVSQVMGTCFYNLSAFGGVGLTYYSGEMRQLTEAQSHSRELAIQRMQLEAKLLGADGVIGVRLKVKRPGGGNRHAEFTAYGTAVRIAGYPTRADTFVSNLSGQEFWKLHTARYLPAGVVMGCCSYYVQQSPQVTNTNIGLNFMMSRNMEIDTYTQSFYEAREIAMSRLQSEMETLHADGAVGVKIDFDVEEREYDYNDRKQVDFVLHYTAMGTAIRKREGIAVSAPLTYIDLSKGRNKGLRVALDQTDTTDREGI